jgi:hypothetical protein
MLHEALSRTVATLAIILASTRIWLLLWGADLDRRIKSQGKRVLNSAICSMFFCLATCAAYSSPLVNASFSGDNGQLSTYYSSIINDLTLAAAKWENLFVSGNPFPLNVNIVFDNSPTANSASLFTTALYDVGPLSVFQQGAVDAVLNGVHNPSGPYDAVINIGTSYLTTELYFDSNPANVNSVPADQTDAESIFTHEFGHIFGFNGNRNQLTGELLSNAESTFDALVSLVNNSPYFTGSNAENVYGGPVPLTVGNIYHVGNASGPGAELVTYPADLMNGVEFYRGTKYSISALDAAMAADLGLVVAVPEPSPIAIFGACVVLFWLSGCRRRSVGTRVSSLAPRAVRGR